MMMQPPGYMRSGAFPPGTPTAAGPGFAQSMQAPAPAGSMQAPVSGRSSYMAPSAATAAPLSASRGPGQMALQPTPTASMVASVPGMAPAPSARELALEQRVRDLEVALAERDNTINDLRLKLAAQPGNSRPTPRRGPGGIKTMTPTSLKNLDSARPAVPYTAVAREDLVDLRFEEFYNSSNATIQFKRINQGFYRFGQDQTVEMQIINHKLMARTEDGWNRGKFGPVERFLAYYEDKFASMAD